MLFRSEENSFLDFDNFSEINKSSTSLKNTDKKEDNKDLKTMEENTNKKEIPDKILNNSMQKNQENFDDICNIRYQEEELNTNKKNEIENNNKIDTESEINRRLNFFNESSTLPKKEKNENPIKEDEDDLVQEKPIDYDNEDDNINIKDESEIKDDIHIEEDKNENNNKNNLENEIKQNLKESETLKDSYCDKLIKNMDEYRKMLNSNES